MASCNFVGQQLDSIFVTPLAYTPQQMVNLRSVLDVPHGRR
jgi:hypothetical protein